MASGARVSIYGKFALHLPSGQPAAFRTRKAAEIVARLALQAPKQIYRPSLAQEIWPEAPETSRLNNLRPALVYIKAAFSDQDALRIDGDQIQLDEGVESDWKDALRVERKSRSGEGDMDRLSALLSLDSILSPGLLEDWNAPWIDPFRVQHQSRRLQTLLQIAQAFQDSGQNDASLEYTHRALEFDPLSEQAMTLRLGIYARLGNTEAAQSEYRKYAQRLQNDFGLEPSVTLHRFALDVIKGRTGTGQVTSSTERQKELVGHLLEVTLKSAPERLLPLFGANEMNWTVMLHDREMLPILESVLDATEGWDTDRRGVVKRLLALCYHQGDSERIEKWAQRMHEAIPAEDIDQVAMCFYLATVAQTRMDVEGNNALMERALALAHLHKDAYLVSVVEANQAMSLCWNGDYQQAEEILLRSIPGLEESTTPNGRFSLSLAYLGLMTINLLRGTHTKALEMGRKWKQTIDLYAVGNVESGGRAAYGLALLLNKDIAGQEMILEGLDLAQRQRRPKVRHSNIVWAAAALAKLGEMEKAKKAFAWILKAREGTAFPVTPGERDLLQRLVGTPPNSALEGLSSAQMEEWLYDNIAGANPRELQTPA